MQPRTGGYLTPNHAGKYLRHHRHAIPVKDSPVVPDSFLLKLFFLSKACHRLALFPGQTMITPATQATTMVVFIQLALKTVDYIIDFLKAILNQALTGFE